jgi:hypothetical protein
MPGCSHIADYDDRPSLGSQILEETKDTADIRSACRRLDAFDTCTPTTRLSETTRPWGIRNLARIVKTGRPIYGDEVIVFINGNGLG